MQEKTSATPVLTTAPSVQFDLQGEIGRRLKAVTEQWILPAPAANPAMLAMFRDRDRKPYRNMVPWAGEFAGKYLTHAAQILRLTGDGELRSHLERFVKELCACQEANGYLGCWPKASALTNHAPNCASNWDTWSSYHMMLGLLLWNEVSGDEAAVRSAGHIADLLCDMYLDGKTPRLVDTGSTEMNLAPIHSLCLLYRKTGVARHLALAKQILDEFAAKDAQGTHLAGDYLQAPLDGKEFSQTPKPRWESLHPIMGLVELYYLTSDESCRKAFESLWWSMLKGDRHNNGGFSSGEKATGNPYDTGAIETCCTVAWMAMSVEMLRLTGDSIVADELELSMLNSGLGMMSPSGRWVTYDTPMDGVREASAHTIVFQARAGSPELNCCSVNGPRALGLLCEWALMRNDKGLAVNYYGPGSMRSYLPESGVVTIQQETDYPLGPCVDLRVSPECRATFTLSLRIPYWSESTHVWINDQEVKGVPCGRYLELRREWSDGDHVRLELDFQLQFWRHQDPAHCPAFCLDYEDWNGDWKLAGPLSNSGNAPHGLSPGDLALDRAVSMDEVLKGGQTVMARSQSGVISLDGIFRAARAHSAAYCFTEVDAPCQGTLPVALGCDWWCTCIVNGQTVRDGLCGGKQTRTSLVSLPLRPGKNLVGFRVTGGSAGWMLSIARGKFIPASEAGGTPTMSSAACSIYRGPLLLAFDPRFYSQEDLRIPPLAAPELELARHTGCPSDTPWLLLEGKGTDGSTVRYCDFASAGSAGNHYRSWVPVRFSVPATEFSTRNPRRSVRAATP